LKNDVSITERDGYTYFTFYDKKSKRDINWCTSYERFYYTNKDDLLEEI
jgi:hypothetical protein